MLIINNLRVFVYMKKRTYIGAFLRFLPVKKGVIPD